jgi:periplasmic protein TonB
MLRATTQQARTRRMTLAVCLSLLVHAAALFAFLWRPVLPAPLLPENQAVVQVLVGTGHPREAEVTPPAPPRTEPAKPKAQPSPPAAVQPPPPPQNAAPPLPAPPSPPPPRTAPPPLPPPPPPPPDVPKTAAPAPPPPQPSPPAKTAAQTPLPEPKVTATPLEHQNLPMEFGDLGGPLARIDPNRDQSLQAATQPDKAHLPPTYPPEAARLGEMGTVALTLHIGADGFVNRVDVVQSSGYPSLDQAAVSRLRTWHFTPAMRGGMPVASIYRIAVTFGP